MKKCKSQITKEEVYQEREITDMDRKIQLVVLLLFQEKKELI